VQVLLNLLADESNAVPGLLQQQQHTRLKVSETAASIIAKVARSPQSQSLFVEAGAIRRLAHFLDISWTTFPKMQEAALDAISSLCRNSAEISASFMGSRVSSESALSTLQRLLKSTFASLRLLAASW
jgi:hypothetical protein